jgi:hypothetical protein
MSQQVSSLRRSYSDLSVLIQTRHSGIYVALTVATLGYSRLTVGPHGKVTSVSSYMIEHKGKIVPGWRAAEGRSRRRFRLPKRLSPEWYSRSAIKPPVRVMVQ